MPPAGESARPGVNVRHLDIADIEPLRAEIEAFFHAARDGAPSPVSGLDGRRALALALRALERIHEHATHPGVSALQETAVLPDVLAQPAATSPRRGANVIILRIVRKE